MGEMKSQNKDRPIFPSQVCAVDVIRIPSEGTGKGWKVGNLSATCTTERQ